MLSYGYMWTPYQRTQFMEEFSKLNEAGGLQIEEVEYKKLSPPTHFYTNEFNSVYQSIVDTYGIPTYKEFNPAPITIITFPFLFGVMFGDVGHGGLLFFLGSFLCIFRNLIVSRYPGAEVVMPYRYLLLLMGFFATYCGLIYNDFMSIPLELFDSCYSF